MRDAFLCCLTASLVCCATSKAVETKRAAGTFQQAIKKEPKHSGVPQQPMIQSCAFPPIPEEKDTHVLSEPKAALNKKASFERRLTETELQNLSPLINKTQKVRQLRFSKKVQVFIEDLDHIASTASSRINEKEQRFEEIIYQMLGLMSQERTLKAEASTITQEQLLGYYNVESGQLVLREALAEKFKTKPALLLYPDEASVVIVHELTHALQDQRLGLKKILNTIETTDQSLAFQSLVEGDATLAMLAFSADLMAISTKQMITGLLSMKGNLAKYAMASVPSKALSAAPPVLRAQMLAPYADGAIYAAELFKKGGWKAINRRYRTPPRSMAEIFHPGASIPAPKSLALPEAIHKNSSVDLLHQDTFGELLFRVFFDQALEEKEANAAAEGWKNDRVFLLKRQDQTPALVWISQWKNTLECDEALKAMQAVLDNTTDKVCRQEFQLRREGTMITLAIHLPEKQNQE